MDYQTISLTMDIVVTELHVVQYLKVEYCNHREAYDTQTHSYYRDQFLIDVSTPVEYSSTAWHAWAKATRGFSTY